MAAIAQRDVGDVADVHAVDEQAAGLDLLAPARTVLADLYRPAVDALEDVGRVDAHRLGQAAVQAYPLVVAVEGEHVARLDEVEHELDLLRVAVAARVDRRVAGGDHLAADLE